MKFKWVKWPYILLAGVFLLAPTVLVMVLSFEPSTVLYFPPTGFSLRWYENFFHNTTWLRAAVTSLYVGVAATVLATVLGTLAAVGLVRGRFLGRGPITALILSPMIAPTVIVGLGMYILFLRLNATGTFPAFIVAHAALGLPFVVVNVSASLRSVDRNVELAAQSLGASPFTTFVRITLPLILPGALAGALFAFLTSFDEVVIAMFLSSPTTQTLPVVMFSGVQYGVDPTVAAASTLLTGVSLVVMLLLTVVRRDSAVAVR